MTAEVFQNRMQEITGERGIQSIVQAETIGPSGLFDVMAVSYTHLALNIKPVMGATPEGTICQLGQARGMTKALDYMVNEIVKRTKECEKKILSIAHCNCCLLYTSRCV